MISQSRYIRIISGVGAGAPVAGRKLILRVMTTNNVIPPGIVIEFDNANAVMSYFGAQSEEYQRAAAYFKFISKSVNSPSSISFARWVNTAIAPMVVGDNLPKTIADFAGFSAGVLTIMVGASEQNITAIDTSAATSMDNVASIIQTEIRKNTDPQLAQATVTWNPNTNQFTLVGATIGTGVLAVAKSADPQDMSTALGWSTSSVVNVAGQAADLPDAAVAKSTNVSNNFGSFLFAGATLDNDQIKAVSAWNAAQNNQFIYTVATSLANLGALFDLVKGNSGTALNVLSATASNDFVEQCPSEILAATNYDEPGASQNYMYYQFPGRNITVSDDTVANTVDKSRGNYIGVTQANGQQLAFYQRGILCGGPTDAVDMNVYANEIWLKSAIAQALLDLFLNVNAVPASMVGEAMTLAVLQPVLDKATSNGTFTYGKDISAVQQQYITQITGDRRAWRQVQTLGYWINITFSSYTNSNTGLTEWKANYTLIYSKGDAIRFVEGSDVMI